MIKQDITLPADNTHELKLKMAANHTFVFKGSSLLNQSLYFWRNGSIHNIPGFRLNWQIENGSLPDVMELLTMLLIL